MMRSLFLTKRWGHHTPSGGYDALAAGFPGASRIGRAGETSRLTRLTRAVWRRWPRADDLLLDYQYGDFLAECRVLTACARGGVDVVHALYGDEQTGVLLRRRRLLRAGLVASFHLPSDLVAERWRGNEARLTGNLDAVVVVSRAQLEDYRRWFGEERVVYIPHGINTGCFRPPDVFRPAETVRLMIVGDTYRDWETLHRVADLCARENLPVAIDAVVPTDARRYFLGCDNVRLHSRVPEDAFIEMYQRADALLLPVTTATANNAVLESLACGTPVISTAADGILDYVDEASGWLFPPGEPRAIVDLVASICRDRSVAFAKRAGARAKALTFGWEVVVEQTRLVHAAVMQGASPARTLAART